MARVLDDSPAWFFDGGADFLGLLSQGHGQAAAPNPLIYLDIWLFGGLVLIVMLVVGGRFLWRSLRPDNRDPSEGLQPWEDPDYDPDHDLDYDPEYDPGYDPEEGPRQ